MFQKLTAAFRRLQYQAKSQFRYLNRSSDGMTKVLIATNLGVWCAWKVCNPYFMSRHFMLSEDSTIRRRRYYTALTYAFSHENIIHLAFNCAGLWFFGKPAEMLLGPQGLLGLYVVGALGGVAGIWWKNRRQRHYRAIPNTLGASASTSAMFAFFVCRNPHATVYFWFIPMPAYAVCGLLLLIGMTSDEIGGISHSGHMGGLIGGAVFHMLAKGRY